MPPPSAADLYQLALAAAKGQHNGLYVLAAEGTYFCQLLPSLLHRILPEMQTFLRHYGHSPREADKAIATCVQPRLHHAQRLRHQIPHLWELLSKPTQAYKSLAHAPGGQQAHAMHFCQAVSDVGLEVVFLPPTDQ